MMIKIAAVLIGIALVAVLLRVGEKFPRTILGIGVALLLFGHVQGLFVAPKENYMQDVGRILYVHVPTAWIALLTYLFAFFYAVSSLWSAKQKSDAYLVATIEVGILLNFLLTLQGAIWAKPTWGVWWSWDPRLTTNAIMLISFVGVLLFRNSISNIERRSVLTAVGSIISFVNVPIVYASVKWWKSLHQSASTPETVSSTMHLPLRVAAFGMLFVAIAFIILRAKIALRRLQRESEAPDLPNNDDVKPLEV